MLKFLSTAGYLPVYTLASFVIFSTTTRVPTVIYDGVYGAEAGGQGGFTPLG